MPNNTKWSDLNKDGRRVEGIIKQMNTVFWTQIEKNPDLALSYVDRIVKLEQVKTQLVDRVLGVKKMLKGEVFEPEIPIR